MTHNQLLDVILSSYLVGYMLKKSNDPRYQKLTFKLVAKAMDPTIEEWNIGFLKDRLFSDGFLKIAEYGDEEPFELTAEGIKAAQQGWYKMTESDKEQDKKIKAETLKNLKRSKVALYISIISIISSAVISLFTFWMTKQSITTKLQNLENRLHEMENVQHEKQTATPAVVAPISPTTSTPK